MYANQAFRVGRHVYGLQFHIETTPEIIHEWAERDVVGVAASPHDRETICPLSDAAHPDVAGGLGAVRRPVRRPRPRPRPPGRLTRMSSAAAEIPRRAVVRLVRFGFEDGERAAGLLSDPALGLWDLERNEPADPEAGPVVAALARAGDPDLAAPVAAPAGRGARRAPTPPAGSAAALLARPARVGPAAQPAARRARARAPASPTTSPPTRGDWTVLDDDGDGIPRGPTGRRRRSSSGRCSPPSAPTPTTRPGACGWARARPTPSPARIAALRLAYRRAILSLAGRDLGEGLPAEDVAAELADIAAAVLHRRPRARRRRAARRRPPPAGWRSSRMGKTGGRELNYVSDVDVVFVAEPVDPSDPRERRAGQRHPRGRRR